MISMLGWRAPACWRANRGKGKKRDGRDQAGIRGIGSATRPSINWRAEKVIILIIG
jgi:hypothetical protein